MLWQTTHHTAHPRLQLLTFQPSPHEPMRSHGIPLNGYVCCCNSHGNSASRTSEGKSGLGYGAKPHRPNSGTLVPCPIRFPAEKTGVWWRSLQKLNVFDSVMFKLQRMYFVASKHKIGLTCLCWVSYLGSQHDATRSQLCRHRPAQSCPWVGLTHGLGWVGSRFFSFWWVGLGPLQKKY